MTKRKSSDIQDSPGFSGFSPQALKFLREVRSYNSRPWYQDNRDTYTEHLLVPFQNLVAALSGTMLSIDPNFETRPAINKTISRIHRDTRFSKDKSLYRDTMWLTFKHPSKEWQSKPAFFFELSPVGYRYGTGFYAARREGMDAFRERINNGTKQFLSSTAFYRKHKRFVLHGDLYKRLLPCDHAPEIQDWYQRKSWYLACNRDIDATLSSSALAKTLKRDFLQMKPLYQFVWHSIIS